MLELDSADRGSSTLQEWLVYPSENSTPYPPVVIAGIDRDVIIGGKTFLSGTIKSVTPVSKTTWTKISGPGNVQFTNENFKEASAIFSVPGDYVLALNVTEGSQAASSTVKVKVHTPPPPKRLDVVYTRHYKIDSRLWNDRIKVMIVNWIPHCIEQIEKDRCYACNGRR
jgi:hypothetical protein